MSQVNWKYLQAAAAAALFSATGPVLAAEPALPVAVEVTTPAPAPAPVAMPTAAVNPIPPGTAIAVAAYYQARTNQPIWLRNPANVEAARSLVPILKRAQLDGLAAGPVFAAAVEAALAKLPAASPAAALDIDRMLSAAWVLYVQAIKAPAPGVAYGDPLLAPRGLTPERILLQVEHSTALLPLVQSVARVNPIYAQLREAAWSQVQVPGGVADGRLVANLARARILPQSGRYVIVDNATQRMFMYQDGQIEDSMKVVVGKKGTPTPLVASTIHYATFNPYWNIPTDVVRRTVAPAVIKKGVAHLKASNFEVASDWTDQATTVPPEEVDWKAVAAGTTVIRIRQLPGKKNMMGAMKFNFPNADGIYLHDSPLRDLFTKSQRSFSLGCIRLEDAPRFARWLLRGREPALLADVPEQHVKLDKGVPVYVTYLTAHAEAGQVTFAPDIYALDGNPDGRLAAAN